MKTFLPLVSALALTVGLAAQGDAATITKDYARYLGPAGQAAQGHYDFLQDDLSYRVLDRASAGLGRLNEFRDVLSLGNIALNTVNSLTFYLSYANAGDGNFRLGPISFTENWSVYTSANGTAVKLGTLSDAHQFSITLSADGSAEEAALLQQVKTTGQFSFWFGDSSLSLNKFDLKRAELTIGTLAAVPVPAAGLMLMGGLGGLALLRRRKTAAKLA